MQGCPLSDYLCRHFPCRSRPLLLGKKYTIKFSKVYLKVGPHDPISVQLSFESFCA